MESKQKHQGPPEKPQSWVAQMEQLWQHWSEPRQQQQQHPKEDTVAARLAPCNSK